MTNEEAKAIFEEDLKDGKCSDDCPECNARELAISAIEKQIPKKVEVTKYDIGGNDYFCHCGNKLQNGAEYCDMCGCKLDWGNAE